MTGKRVLSVVGMLVVFAAAYGFERLMTHMKTQLGVTVSMALAKGIHWVDAVAVLVLAALLLILGWYVITRLNRDKYVGVLFTVVGLALTILVAVELSLERPFRPYWMVEIFHLESYAHFVAAFIAVIGIACLVAPRRRRSRAQSRSS